jgi:hypothetical protein
MSTRPRIPVLFASACAALVLAGCSSTGADSAAGAAQGSSGAGVLTGGETVGTSADAGCTEAMTALQNAEKVQRTQDPQTAVKTVDTSISQLQDAAGKTRKPGGKEAMTKVADDLQTIMSQAKIGKTPDESGAMTDAQALATICGG